MIRLDKDCIMGDLTDNFDRKEFACPCCGQMIIEPKFLGMIDFARVLSGVPFILNSGYRCPKHNREVGSESLNHISGRAADIACTDSQKRRKILKALIEAGFERIGIGKTYLHVDNMDETGAIRCFWVY